MCVCFVLVLFKLLQMDLTGLDLQVLKDSNHGLHRSQTEFVSLTTSSLSAKAANRATADAQLDETIPKEASLFSIFVHSCIFKVT